MAICIYMKGEIIFFPYYLAFAFPAKKMNDHCFSKTGDSWSDTVPKTMTLVLIFSGSPNSETKNDNWAQRGWNHSHHYIRTKTLETEPETPRSSVESRTLYHKASWSEGWSQQYHARELSWKHSSENRVLDFGNRLKHILMVRKRLNNNNKKMKSDTEDGVELRGHCGNERTHHCYKTGHDRLERPICPARMPMSKCARICLLWHHSSHDSACRTMW